VTTPELIAKLRAEIEVAKRAGEGDYREKAINAQTFYVMANPVDYIARLEVLIECLETLEFFCPKGSEGIPTSEVAREGLTRASERLGVKT